MLVYGDRSRIERPQVRLRALTAILRAAEEAPHGQARHDFLTSAFIRAGELAQGLADADFERQGFDDRSAAQDASLGLLLALARKLAASLGSGFVAAGPPVAPELMALALTKLPETISTKTPEGYAFYAVYPEAYLKAAAAHPWGAPPLVIGLRSIGTGLAALVAAVTGARTVVSLRPSGHPFRREVRVSEALRATLAAHAGRFAIVDEGPGLSGSSFGATADLLESLGVGPERIVFMPSHGGDLGPEATERHRARWAQAARPVATFAQLVDDDPIETWFADLTGPVDHVEDLSAGAWRRWRSGDPDGWPPANSAQERLKFRLDTASGSLLAKFAGLGEIGEAKLARAEALHRAGFTVEPLGLRRGFLLERWETGRPAEFDRGGLVQHLARYLAFRCATFPAQPEDGADLEALKTMARVNVSALLGADAATALATRLDALQPAQRPRPIHVDGRLHAWEWLVTPDGLLLKTDAVDHSEAHDLVGCQDVAWDIAGAAAEFDLSPSEVARLCAGVEARCGRPVDQDLLQLMEICYPAFQAGYWRFAEAAAPEDERRRIAAHAARYAERLSRLAAEA
jgi:hypothetical protein